MYVNAVRGTRDEVPKLAAGHRTHRSCPSEQKATYSARTGRRVMMILHVSSVAVLSDRTGQWVTIIQVICHAD